MTDKTQQEIASDLARFLTTPVARGYGLDKRSPLDEILNAQITQMTREIAAEVIAATPEIRDHVKRMVESTVKRALQNDSWLNQTVVGAVSKAITDLALERQREREDGS